MADYIKATPGEVYQNRGGGRYLCRSSFGTDATMQNVASGWVCIAHNVQRYEDGTIEWDWSTQMGFAPLPEGKEIRDEDRDQ